MEPLRICFVCLGNICRSPLAESVLREKVHARGADDRVRVASRGTGDWHVGEPPDPRMQTTARRHGVKITGTAQQFAPADYAGFDLVLAMDTARYEDLLDGAPEDLARRIVPFRAFDPEGSARDDVPDPYYGGQGGFETVYEIVDRTCEALLDRLLDGTWKEVRGGREALAAD